MGNVGINPLGEGSGKCRGGGGGTASGTTGEKEKQDRTSRGEREGYKPPYSIYFYFLLLGEVIGPDETVLRGGWKREPPRHAMPAALLLYRWHQAVPGKAPEIFSRFSDKAFRHFAPKCS